MVLLVGISGSTRRPSRTAALVRAIVDSVARRLDVEPHIVELADAAPQFLPLLTRADANKEAGAVIRAVETADILIVGTPVYRASYTGALKHLFDLVHHDALAGKPVLLAATGGSAMHGLVTEHQLRPLMGFFRALSLPTAIYATEADFIDGVITSADVLRRIERAAYELAELVAGAPALCAAPSVRHRRVPVGV